MRPELWVGLEVKSSHLQLSTLSKMLPAGLEESDSQQSSLVQRRTVKQGSARLWHARHTGLLVPARRMWEQNRRPKASLNCIVSPDSKNKNIFSPS